MQVGKVCRTMLRDLHPDKVQGVDKETLKEIQERWDLIRTGKCYLFLFPERICPFCVTSPFHSSRAHFS